MDAEYEQIPFSFAEWRQTQTGGDPVDRRDSNVVDVHSLDMSKSQ